MYVRAVHMCGKQPCALRMFGAEADTASYVYAYMAQRRTASSSHLRTDRQTDRQFGRKTHSEQPGQTDRQTETDRQTD